VRTKRPLLVGAALLLAAAVALPAAAMQSPSTASPSPSATPEGMLAYALQGDADAFRLGLGSEGLSLGFARANANSVPTASGLASAECRFDPEGAAICQEGATEESSYPGHEGDDETSCATPEIPGGAGRFLDLGRGCAFSKSGAEADFPFTTNETTADPITIAADGSAVPRRGPEDLEDQLVGELENLIRRGPGGKRIGDLAEQILEALRDGQLGEIELGPSSSDIDPDGDILTVTSAATGPIIRLLGVPAAPRLYQGCDTTKDDEGTKTAWLYSIAVGEATASAFIDVGGRTVDIGDANAAPVSVTSPNPDTNKPTDCRTETIAESTDALVIAEGTPIQSSISVGGKRTEVGDDFAIAEADGVSITLFELGDEPDAVGPDPIVIGAGRANAAVAIRVDLPEASPTPTRSPTQEVLGNPPKEPRVLADTGGDDYLPYAIVLLLAAALLGITARRLARR
jgi:hypothetical protein